MQDLMSKTATPHTYPIRTATAKDIPELRELFRSTVLTVNAKDYTPEETADWASCGDSTAHWEKLLVGLHFFTASDENGRIIGFSSIRHDGYLHSLFVHKDWQGKGVASALLSETEIYAIRKLGATEITSEVSITARPFFEKQGYTAVKEQKAQANRLKLTNYVMTKAL